MTKSIILVSLAALFAAPALAAEPAAPEKKCCCDKMGDKAMDHSQMDHGSNAPK